MKEFLDYFLIISICFVLSDNKLNAQCDASEVFSNDTTNAVCNTIEGKVRTIYTNNLPNHSFGNWPSNNTVDPQELEFKMCAFPRKADESLSIYNSGDFNGCSQYIEFGVGSNGIRMAPFGARWFVNPQTQEENFDWNIEALVQFNMDFNNSHSNPSGEYHYHGIPSSYFNDSLKIDGSAHSPIVGYAADGFPIYYKYVYSDPNDINSNLTELSSGYTLKEGERPGNGVTAPDGNYDGLYVEDYEYLNFGWELDECNGRFGVTPEHPEGTYYYVMTDNWPYIPRCFYGSVVDNSFRIGPNCPDSNAEMDCSDELTSVNEGFGQLEIRLSPNPASNILKVDGFSNFAGYGLMKLSIYDVNGKVWFVGDEIPENIDVSDFPKGNYFLQISDEENQITKRVVIQ